MMKDEFPETVGAHPYRISRWLMELQDWVDGPLRTRAFMPDEIAHDDVEILYVAKVNYDRMLRESRAYYAMREEIRRMADHLLTVLK